MVLIISGQADKQLPLLSFHRQVHTVFPLQMEAVAGNFSAVCRYCAGIPIAAITALTDTVCPGATTTLTASAADLYGSGQMVQLHKRSMSVQEIIRSL